MRSVAIILLSGIAFFSSLHKSSGNKNESDEKILPEQSSQQFQQIKENVKEGDLVVRLNRDPSSQVIKNLNHHDKKYSHAGLVFFENGEPYIYQMMSGSENPDEKLDRVELVKFCDTRENSAVGVFRYAFRPDELSKLKSLIHDWYKRAILFDKEFDLKTDDKMYCSEMISKAITRATRNRIKPGSTILTPEEAKLLAAYFKKPEKLFRNKKGVMIDNLYLIKNCSPVIESKY
ncbi:MAG TPA: YiiX/YebB-like N1pC/P60 family cysteine hydrolase [Chitinophagaceae bacterium]|nr:hypothetical protein [Chitinophagales bacterium]HPG12308.1 YiiX/YebB-like N1pC/P60 family cysteine hydrolase [Chitinophagaceae bacterium]